MSHNAVSRYLSAIGKKGGTRSRRTLDPFIARRMVALREARRAFKEYNSLCFWSYNPEAVIGLDDIPWVVSALQKEGDRRAYDWARRIASAAGL